MPGSIPFPPYATDANYAYENRAEEILVHPEEVKAMKNSCRLARRILDYAGSLVKPGVTTDFIDSKVHQKIISEGAYPSPLRYRGFPKSICTSVNSIVVHGIPDERPLVEGDIINIDVTVFKDGFHGDVSETFAVGQVDPQAQALMNTAKEALNRGIEVCGPGKGIRLIGQAIEKVATAHGYGVVDILAGHGVGRRFHNNPVVIHVSNDSKEVMKPGMVFTIEPGLVEANPQLVIWDDNWTLETEDGGWSAQFEHTVLITEEGVEVLTSRME